MWINRKHGKARGSSTNTIVKGISVSLFQVIETRADTALTQAMAYRILNSANC